MRLLLSHREKSEREGRGGLEGGGIARTKRDKSYEKKMKYKSGVEKRRDGTEHRRRPPQNFSLTSNNYSYQKHRLQDLETMAT
jgi:hypothetical protein